MPRGGPDGGSGGRGGSIRAVADPSQTSLEEFVRKPNWSAPNGGAGAGSRKEGKGAPDLVLRVPVGTVIVEEPEGEVLADLDRPGAEALLAAGGAGGRGNVHFASPTHRSPRFAEPGEPGEDRDLRLELKLIADVGLVGPPNAGKSSLLRALSAARPEVAAYPFTTLEPVLGVAEGPGGERFVVADIPGLLPGAAQGAGLGLEFLRHVERTRVLLYVVDGAGDQPWADLAAVRAEVAQYSPNLAARPALVAVNKIDLARARVRRAQGAPEPVWFVSALTKEGIPELVAALVKALARARPAPAAPALPQVKLWPRPARPAPRIERRGGGYRVSDPAVERMLRRADLGSEPGLEWFQLQLRRLGVTAALEAAGAEPGDTVQIGPLEFEYQPG